MSDFNEINAESIRSEHIAQANSNQINLSKTHLSETSNTALFRQGVLDILPLSIAVLPWGILAGSMAINAGLSTAQAFAMSSVIFAGAAQLVSLGLVMSDASALTILLTVFFLTSQHLIYALNMRADIQHFSWQKRLVMGFLLTDELFAVSQREKASKKFSYLFGAGLCFYLSWCVFSVLGMLLARSIPNLDSLHLDFSIAALFILIIVPLIKNLASLVGVLVTVIFVCIFKYFAIEAGIVLAALTGMLSAVCMQKAQKGAQK